MPLFFRNSPIYGDTRFFYTKRKGGLFSLVPGMNKEHRLKEFLEHYRKNAERLRKLPYEGIPDEILYRFCFSKDLFFSERPSRADMIAKMNCYCVESSRNDIKEFLRKNITHLEQELEGGRKLSFCSAGLGFDSDVEALIQRWDQSIENRKNYRVKKILLEKFAPLNLRRLGFAALENAVQCSNCGDYGFPCDVDVFDLFLEDECGFYFCSSNHEKYHSENYTDSSRICRHLDNLIEHFNKGTRIVVG